MSHHPVRTTRRRLLAGVALTATLSLMALTPASAAADRAAAKPGPKPTVVLVHGAFADASGWNGVISRLTHSGYEVIAPANPLRDLTTDSNYIASLVKELKKPVILVGHSYGGAVITNAARGADNVKGLVYVAAFAPEQGESVGSITKKFPDTPLDKPGALVPRAFTNPDGTPGTDLYINTAKFRDIFAKDVPAHQAALMAATQRPIAAAAFGAPSGAPAWKTVPSWFQISARDAALHPDAQRFMAKRAGAKKIVELNASHSSAVSRPGEIADLIRTAARAS